MKQPWEWNEDDLSALVANGVQESIELDYKSCAALASTDAKKNEVSKDVSAFANSAGGTVVYGMLEDKHVPTRLDVGYDPRGEITKEWLEQVINSRIQRKIDGIRINSVELKTHSPGKVAYVVSVPQSVRAPHQASDKRFYKRYNFESVPMEEYEVRDVSRRSESPDLVLRLRTSMMPGDENPAPGQNALIQIRLHASATNESVTPAEHLVCNLYIDTRLPVLRLNSQLTPAGNESTTMAGQEYPWARFDMVYSALGKPPLFNGVSFQIWDSPVFLGVPVPGRYAIGWQLRAPYMAPKRGGYFLDWDGSKVEFTEV